MDKYIIKSIIKSKKVQKIDPFEMPDKEKTILLAEKLRVAIENFNFKTIGTQTCSFGVSEFLLSDTSKDEMIKRADKALYKAKNSGKNKVVVY